MPTYKYKCDGTCRPRTFEYWQNMSDKPLKECPKCGGKVKRLIGAGAGILFKGTGFYYTDYKRKKDEGRV